MVCGFYKDDCGDFLKHGVFTSLQKALLENTHPQICLQHVMMVSILSILEEELGTIRQLFIPLFSYSLLP